MSSRHRVRWTRLALADLVAIRDFVALDDPAVAEALIDRLREAVDRLEGFPESGRLVPERRAQGYREVILRPYRLVYSLTQDEVHVLRVWHGRRDPESLKT